MIKVEVSKRQRERGLLRDQKLALGFIKALGEEIKRRVAEQGKPARHFKGYASKGNRPVFVAPGYPGAPSSDSPTGVVVYASSKDFHDEVMNGRPGSFNVSGGMWSGLSALPRGKRGAVLKFRGRSTGWKPKFKKYKSGATKAKARKVSNALKSASVGSLGINVIEPIKAETNDLAKALQSILFGGGWSGLGRVGTVARQLGLDLTGAGSIATGRLARNAAQRAGQR